jgi:3-methylcrotonyl-CoA carboxylase beta subunit
MSHLSSSTSPSQVRIADNGPLQPTDGAAESIKAASKNVAKELWSYYAVPEGDGWHINGGYPGIIWEPYFWWQCGGMFGTFLDYWRYTGDSQYNDMVREGMIHQMGEHLDLVRAWTSIQKKFRGTDTV